MNLTDCLRLTSMRRNWPAQRGFGRELAHTTEAALTAQASWSALGRGRVMPQGIVNATWMRQAACRAWPELPWTTDSVAVSAWDVLNMHTVCDRCPVRSACLTAVATGDVCGGWWAGEDRAADAVTVPMPTWTPVHGGISQGVLPFGAVSAA